MRRVIRVMMWVLPFVICVSFVSARHIQLRPSHCELSRTGFSLHAMRVSLDRPPAAGT